MGGWRGFAPSRQCNRPEGDIPCYNRFLMSPTCVPLCGNIGACHPGSQDFRRPDLVWSYEVDSAV
jgi:hypothetical protein